MNLRRLTTDDADLLRVAWWWDANAPAWYKATSDVFDCDEGQFIARLEDPEWCFIGIWADDYCGLTMLELLGNGVVEAHLCAKRGTSIEFLTEALYQVREQLGQIGMRGIVVWVAQRNRAIKNLCLDLGFVPDGVRMIRGSYKKRLIVWQRMLYTAPIRAAIEMAA